MADKGIDQLASENLQRACLGEINFGLSSRDGLGQLISTAFMQANFAQHALQAVITLLKQKNIISDTDLTKALADAYNDAASHKRTAGQSKQIIVPPAPRVGQG